MAVPIMSVGLIAAGDLKLLQDVRTRIRRVITLLMIFIIPLFIEPIAQRLALLALGWADETPSEQKKADA